jgi:hypothetical protein
VEAVVVVQELLLEIKQHRVEKLGRNLVVTV